MLGEPNQSWAAMPEHFDPRSFAGPFGEAGKSEACRPRQPLDARPSYMNVNGFGPAM